MIVTIAALSALLTADRYVGFACATSEGGQKHHEPAQCYYRYTASNYFFHAIPPFNVLAGRRCWAWQDWDHFTALRPRDTGVSPVHNPPNLKSADCSVNLWSNQILLKKQGKLNVEDGTWDKAEQWDQILGHYAAIVDQPGHMFVAELARAYPDAKVILTVRVSPEVWLDGYRDTMYARHVGRSESWQYQGMAFFRWLFGSEGHFERVRRAMAYNDQGVAEPQVWWYTQHNEHVRKHVPGDRLLEFNVKDGWALFVDSWGIRFLPSHFRILQPVSRLDVQNSRTGQVGYGACGGYLLYCSARGRASNQGVFVIASHSPLARPAEHTDMVFDQSCKNFEVKASAGVVLLGSRAVVTCVCEGIVRLSLLSFFGST